MSDTPIPDRIAVDRSSPFYDKRYRGLGVRFNGAEKTNVHEYCVSEGWVRLSAGRSHDRHGRPLTLKFKGVVEPYWRQKA